MQQPTVTIDDLTEAQYEAATRIAERDHGVGMTGLWEDAQRAARNGEGDAFDAVNEIIALVTMTRDELIALRNTTEDRLEFDAIDDELARRSTTCENPQLCQNHGTAKKSLTAEAESRAFMFRDVANRVHIALQRYELGDTAEALILDEFDGHMGPERWIALGCLRDLLFGQPHLHTTRALADVVDILRDYATDAEAGR